MSHLSSTTFIYLLLSHFCLSLITNSLPTEEEKANICFLWNARNQPSPSFLTATHAVSKSPVYPFPPTETHGRTWLAGVTDWQESTAYFCSFVCWPQMTVASSGLKLAFPNYRANTSHTSLNKGANSRDVTNIQAYFCTFLQALTQSTD